MHAESINLSSCWNSGSNRHCSQNACILLKNQEDINRLLLFQPQWIEDFTNRDIILKALDLGIALPHPQASW
jgi:hypothetical protein